MKTKSRILIIAIALIALLSTLSFAGWKVIYIQNHTSETIWVTAEGSGQDVSPNSEENFSLVTDKKSFYVTATLNGKKAVKLCRGSGSIIHFYSRDFE